MNVPRAGTFHIQAQERIVFGVPAGEAVVAEADRVGAKRVFVTSTRSLTQKEDGPLQRMEKALGSRHVGTYSAISSHSPREDVVAGAKAARAAKADLLVAVGGGSVIDATKAMLLCLWEGLDSPEAMEPYCSGFDRTKAPKLAPPADADPHGGGVDHALGIGVHRERRHHPVGHQHQADVPSPPVRAARGGARSRLHARHAGLAAVLHRHPLGRPRGRELLQRQGEPGDRGSLAAGPQAALPRPAGDQEEPAGPRAQARGADRHVAGDRPVRIGRADRRQPRHRLRAGRHLRRAARAHLLRDAACGPEVECGRQRRAAEGAVGGDGRAGPAGDRSHPRAGVGPRPAHHAARGRHQAREPRGDRAPLAQLPAGASSTRARSRPPTTSRRSWRSRGRRRPGSDRGYPRESLSSCSRASCCLCCSSGDFASSSRTLL